MPVAGVGGLLGNLFFPGLDDRLAQHITPNPNPLAQQGGPVDPKAVDSLGNAVPAQQPNLAPAAVTQPDPISASYAKDLLAASRRDANAQSFNEGLDRMAASFGTAQQQASKQAALRHGGGVGGSLADLAGIQGMQDQTIKDNERARFMGNAAVFAQTLSQALGRPVSIQEAREIQDNPDMMSAISRTVGANATTTDTSKDVDQAMRSWADAHPQATPAEIAQHRSDLLEQKVGGLSTIGKSLAEDRRNYMAAHQGATMAQMIADRPDLADETSYVAIKGEKGKQAAIAGQEKQNAIDTFPSLDVPYQTAEQKIEWLNAHPEALARAIHWGDAAKGVVGQAAGAFGVLDKDTADARGILDQLNDINFRGGMTNVKNVRSQVEALKIGGSVSNIDKRANSDEQIQAESRRLFDIAHTSRANLLGAAGKQIPARYTGLVDPSYLDPNSSVYNGSTLEKIDFSKMSKEDADRAWEALPPGTVFTDTDGSPKRKPW